MQRIIYQYNDTGFIRGIVQSDFAESSNIFKVPRQIIATEPLMVIIGGVETPLVGGMVLNLVDGKPSIDENGNYELAFPMIPNDS